MTRRDEIADQITTYPSEPGPSCSDQMQPYAGPLADVLARLEERIAALEDARGARIEAGSLAVDTRPGLSVQDVADLIRAAKS